MPIETGRAPTKHNLTLTITSLLSILFAVSHLADDISRGMAPAGLFNLPMMLVLAVWLYATVVLAERRSGLVIILVLSLFTSYLPVLHMMGRSGITGGASGGSGEAVFFAFTLLALGGTAIVSVILSAQGLWNLRRGLAPREARS